MARPRSHSIFWRRCQPPCILWKRPHQFHGPGWPCNCQQHDRQNHNSEWEYRRRPWRGRSTMGPNPERNNRRRIVKSYSSIYDACGRHRRAKPSRLYHGCRFCRPPLRQSMPSASQHKRGRPQAYRGRPWSNTHHNTYHGRTFPGANSPYRSNRCGISPVERAAPRDVRRRPQMNIPRKPATHSDATIHRIELSLSILSLYSLQAGVLALAHDQLQRWYSTAAFVSLVALSILTAIRLTLSRTSLLFKTAGWMTLTLPWCLFIYGTILLFAGPD